MVLDNVASTICDAYTFCKIVINVTKRHFDKVQVREYTLKLGFFPAMYFRLVYSIYECTLLYRISL